MEDATSEANIGRESKLSYLDSNKVSRLIFPDEVRCLAVYYVNNDFICRKTISLKKDLKVLALRFFLCAIHEVSTIFIVCQRSPRSSG